jgi:asparagine synthetase B (glutamine-hydrolysing)
MLHSFNSQKIADTNDTKYLFEHLRDETQILATISRTQGPYSFIFVTKQTIYFGKDPMGRRSLLHTYDGQAFKLTSTAPDKSAWNELGTDGIYSLDRNTNSLTLHLWSDMYERYNVTPVLISRPETSITPEQDFIIDANLYQQSVDKLIILLTRSVEKRVTNIYDTQDRAHVGVLFSGGIDSVIITAMAQLVLQNQPIDLLNVSFGSSQKQIDSGADRKQAIEAYQELKYVFYLALTL